MNDHEKIKLLRRLVKEYLPYMDKWKSVDVHYDRFDRSITVTWYEVVKKEEVWAGNKKKRNYINFTKREFHIDNIDERIQSYRNKIRYVKNK